jgi:hypothetical protein
MGCHARCGLRGRRHHGGALDDRRPESLILYSGSPDACNAHERIFESLGTTMYLGADAGRASLYDIALLSAMYGMFGGFFHAIAMVSSPCLRGLTALGCGAVHRRPGHREQLGQVGDGVVTGGVHAP